MSISDYYYDEINSEENLNELDAQEPTMPEDFEHPFVDEEKERKAGFFEEDDNDSSK